MLSGLSSPRKRRAMTRLVANTKIGKATHPGGTEKKLTLQEKINYESTEKSQKRLSASLSYGKE